MAFDDEDLESQSIRISDTEKFIPREDDDETMWEVIEITAEKPKFYRVRWAGTDPKTGKPYPQDWVHKTDCTEDIVLDWKRRKAQKGRRRKSTKSAASRKSRVSATSAISKASTVSTASTVKRRDSRTSSTAVAPTTHTNKRRHSDTRDQSVPPIATVDGSPAKKRRRITQSERDNIQAKRDALKQEEESDSSAAYDSPRAIGKDKDKTVTQKEELVEESEVEEIPASQMLPIKIGPPRKSAAQGSSRKPIIKKVTRQSDPLAPQKTVATKTAKPQPSKIVKTATPKIRKELSEIEEEEDELSSSSGTTPKHHASSSPKRTIHKNRPYLDKVKRVKDEPPARELSTYTVDRLHQFDEEVGFVSPVDSGEPGNAHAEHAFEPPDGLLVSPSRQSPELRAATERELSPEIPLDESVSNSFLSQRQWPSSASPPPPSLALPIKPKAAATTTFNSHAPLMTNTSTRLHMKARSRNEDTTEIVPGTETQSSEGRTQPQSQRVQQAQVQSRKAQSSRLLPLPEPKQKQKPSNGTTDLPSAAKEPESRRSAGKHAATSAQAVREALAQERAQREGERRKTEETEGEREAAAEKTKGRKRPRDDDGDRDRDQGHGRVDKPLKPIRQLSPSTFAPHLPSSAAALSGDEQYTGSEEESEEDEEEEEMIDQFSSPEKQQRSTRGRMKAHQIGAMAKRPAPKSVLQRGRELAEGLRNHTHTTGNANANAKSNGTNAASHQKLVKGSSVPAPSTQEEASRDSIQEFASSERQLQAMIVPKTLRRGRAGSGSMLRLSHGVGDGDRAELDRAVEQMENAYLDLNGGAASSPPKKNTALPALAPAPPAPPPAPAAGHQADNTATFEEEEDEDENEEVLVASQIWVAVKPAAPRREEEEETTQDVLMSEAAQRQQQQQQAGRVDDDAELDSFPPPPPSTPLSAAVGKSAGVGGANRTGQVGDRGEDGGDAGESQEIGASLDQHIDEDWSRAPNWTSQPQQQTERMDEDVPETQQYTMDESSREEVSQTQLIGTNSFEDPNQAQHLKAALALLDEKSTEIATLERRLAATQEELESIRLERDKLLSVPKVHASTTTHDVPSSGPTGDGGDSQGMILVQSTQSQSQSQSQHDAQTQAQPLQPITPDQTQSYDHLSKDLDEIRERLAQDKSQWEQEKARLEAALKAEQASKASLAKDVDFFRDQYTRASVFVTSVREENEELEEKARVAEGQAKDGVAMIRATFENQLKRLEADKDSWKRMAEFLAEKDRRTNDEIRRRAAEYPEMESKYQVMEIELGDEKMLRFEKQMLLEERDKEIARLRERLQRWEAAASDAEGIMAQRVDESGVLVYPCRWRPAGSEESCYSVFLSTEALQNHILTSGHLDD